VAERFFVYESEYWKYVPVAATLGPAPATRHSGPGYFFHDQMITPVLLNGKGRLPPR